MSRQIGKGVAAVRCFFLNPVATNSQITSGFIRRDPDHFELNILILPKLFIGFLRRESNQTVSL